jgi:hypothetical protein
VAVAITKAKEARRPKAQALPRALGDLSYAAKTWDEERRVVLKAERLLGKDNPRFVLTDLEGEPEEIYARYCLRGEIENRIKELKLDCFSGRTSCHSFRANCFRLLLHAAAFVLLSLLKAALAGTELARGFVRHDPPEAPQGCRPHPKDHAQNLGASAPRVPRAKPLAAALARRRLHLIPAHPRPQNTGAAGDSLPEIPRHPPNRPSRPAKHVQKTADRTQTTGQNSQPRPDFTSRHPKHPLNPARARFGLAHCTTPTGTRFAL